jgi:hypothetical protein
MPKKIDPYQEIEKQIDGLVELLDQIVSDSDPETRLPRLDTASRAAMNILRMIKTLRELNSAAEDPTALLRKALAELEAEWPDLRDCKEMLRSGGAASGEAASPTEASNEAQ